MPKEMSLVRAEVRSALNEVSPRFWDNAMLNTWINEAARDISRRSECFLTVSAGAITANQQDITANIDTIRIHRVEFNFTSDTQVYVLQARTLAEMDQYWG